MLTMQSSLDSGMKTEQQQRQSQNEQICNGINVSESIHGDVEQAQQMSITSKALKTFELVHENEYKGVAGALAVHESMRCQCTASDDCGDDCINRLMMYECTKCLPGDRCKNRRFQRKQYAPIEIFDAGVKGFGIKTLETLEANTFVMEYVGEVVSLEAFQRRTRQYEAEGLPHFYCMALQKSEMIDATKKGGIARFLNHSCNPNCVLQKWVVGKKFKMGIFTKRFIPAMTELTFDYKFERYGAPAQTCHCGEPQCKGTIGVSKNQQNGAVAQQSADAYDEYADWDFDDEADSQKSNGDSNGVRQSKKDLAGFQSSEHVLKGIKIVTQSSQDKLQGKIIKFLDKVLATEDDNCLRQFMYFNGLALLKQWSSLLNSQQFAMVKIIQSFDKLPIATYNTIQDSDLVSMLDDLCQTSDSIVAALAQTLRQKWNNLPKVYVIPKSERQNVEMSDDEDQKDQNMSSVDESQNGDGIKSPTAGYDMVNTSLSSKNQQRQQQQQQELPAGWAMAFDQMGVYYLHLESGGRQRDFPTASDAPVSFFSGTLGGNMDMNGAQTDSNRSSVTYIDGVSQDALQAILDRAQQQSLEEERLRRERLKLQKAKKRKSESSSHSSAPHRSSSSKLKNNSTAEDLQKTQQDDVIVLDVGMKQEVREEIGQIVVKYLSKYKAKLSNEDFKKHARKITHLVIDKESRDKTVIALNEETRHKIRKFVDNYASKLQATSHQ
ncbi:hypothetical protein MIR68_003704 [Amoeboaphelidium protococcarum]|nr:hypothetical protein MIR68_003704 [Amoeboaphelidium protococcarum]